MPAISIGVYRHDFCLRTCNRRFPMNKVLCLMFGLCLLSESAEADTVRFTCQTEESANMVAAALAIGQEEADEVAHPFLVRGLCEYLPDDMFVYVVHRGETFGSTKKITVV